MSQLNVNTLQIGQSATPANNFVFSVPSPEDGTIKLSRGNVGSTTQDVISVNASGVVSFPATGSFGKILQVVQTVKTDVFSTSSASYTDITGFSAAITPSSTSNKILVIVYAYLSNSNNTSTSFMRLVRDSTPVFVGDASGSRTQATGAGPLTQYAASTFSPCFLDSPATSSSVTYKIQILSDLGQVTYLNRSGVDANSVGYGRFSSSITLIEVVP